MQPHGAAGSSDRAWIHLISRPGRGANAFIKYEKAVTLSVYIDGVAHFATWGPTVIPVTPGDHVIAAQAQAFVAFASPVGPAMPVPLGLASQPIHVSPGQTVTLYYAAPNSPGTPGYFSYTPPPPAPINVVMVVQVVALTILAAILLLMVSCGVYIAVAA